MILSKILKIGAGVIILFLFLLFSLYYIVLCFFFDGDGKADVDKFIYNNDSLSYYKDEYNRLVFQKKALYVDFETIKNIKDGEIGNLKNELSTLKNLVSTTRVKYIEKLDTFVLLKTEYIKDTLGAGNDSVNVLYDTLRHFSYEDKWLFLNGNISKDTVRLNYNLNNTVYLNTFWKRSGIFADNELVITMVSENPRVKPETLQTLVVKPEKRDLLKNRAIFLGSGIFIGIASVVGIVSLIK